VPAGVGGDSSIISILEKRCAWQNWCFVRQEGFWLDELCRTGVLSGEMGVGRTNTNKKG